MEIFYKQSEIFRNISLNDVVQGIFFNPAMLNHSNAEATLNQSIRSN